ncbi:MAG: acetate--CoA ligase family protein [Burkholderiaceae bacterium]
MTASSSFSALYFGLHPRSVAVIGASDNPNKVGGRPIHYMRQFGFQGVIYPVNPGRTTVQGLPCYPSLAALPQAPDAAVVAVGSDRVLDTLEECAAAGVKTAIVLSSGFAETGADGVAAQARLSALAARSGMRIAGPNTQGLANFHEGAVMNFSTMFSELPPQDGPIAIVSQSGATSAALYTFLRLRGLGVRYVLATGNEADVTVAELAGVVAQDRDIRLIILYLESLQNPEKLAEAAALARAHGVPVVALKAGRSASGARAAQSHTGALVNDDHVVDAFFARHAIARMDSIADIIQAAPVYLKGFFPDGEDLTVISNSGSACVMSADMADALGMALARLAPGTQDQLKAVLDAFAATQNPIDLTASLLSNSGILGKVLDALANDPAGSYVLISLPVAGAGYDLERLARDAAQFEAATHKMVVVTASIDSVLAPFQAQGLLTFTGEPDAIRAIHRVVRHKALLARPAPRTAPTATSPATLPADTRQFLDEASSLRLLADNGIPVVTHRVCASADDAVAAWRACGGAVAVKACSPDLPHKSEAGLVFLNVDSEPGVRHAFNTCRQGMAALKAHDSGVVVAAMTSGRRELALGGKMDPVFGPVVMISDGGKYIEAMPDFTVLIAPFSIDDVQQALGRLRIAPLFAGVRGEPPMDTGALCALAVRLGDLMARYADTVQSVDMNPVLIHSEGEGVTVLDALVERRLEPESNRPGH